MVQTRVTSQRQIGYVPHTSVSGEAWQCVQTGITDSAGAANGTTLIDSNGDSGAAHTFAGRYWVRCKDGDNENLMKRIAADDGAGTLTLENNGFPNQVASGVAYEIWLSPEPVVVVDSSSGETNMVDAVRAEADDYWLDFYACPITGNRRGRIAKITDHVSGSGTFTLEAGLGGALAAGDVVLLRRFFEASDIGPGVSTGYEETPMDRLDGNRGDGRVVSKSGNITFSTELYGLAAASASGSAARRAPFSHMMQAGGYKEIIGTSSTIGAGSTTSAISVATGSWENHPIDSVVTWNGEMRFVTSTSDGGAGVDTVNVAPPLTVAPVDGETLRGGITYRRNRNGSDGDYLGVCLEYEVDGVRYTMTGCKGNVSTVDGERLMLSWDLQVDHWVREIERAPYYAGSAYPSARPIMATERKCWVDTTATDMGGITASLNNEVAPKSVQGSSGINGRTGFGHVSTAAGATFRQLLDADGELPADERFNARTALAFTVVYGGGYRTSFGLRIPQARVVQDPMPEDAAGMLDAPNVLRAHDPGTATDGDGTVTRKADFMVAYG